MSINKSGTVTLSCDPSYMAVMVGISQCEAHPGQKYEIPPKNKYNQKKGCGHGSSGKALM
jgi:hypothetical protein